MGLMSYAVILSGGIVGNKLRGVGNTLKDFSLPISMSFRLFGALLSGALVTELVYYYASMNYVIPVLRRCNVYPAARTHTNLRTYNAHGAFLRRGIGAASKKT